MAKGSGDSVSDPVSPSLGAIHQKAAPDHPDKRSCDLHYYYSPWLVGRWEAAFRIKGELQAIPKIRPELIH